MNVKQLKELLEKYNDGDEVILSSDSEGNNFSPLSGIEEVIYVPENSWTGETHLRELSEKDILAGYTEEDLYDGDDGVKAIVLSPIN
jgi:hypothetical protein